MKFILKFLLILSLTTLLNTNIVNGLQCYLCFGCRNTTASIQTCSATQTFCYTKTYSTNLYVEKACIDKCIPGIQATDGANVTCCNNTLCNYDNTVMLPTTTTTTTNAAQSSTPTTNKTTTTTTTATQSGTPTTTKTTTTTTTTAAQSGTPTTTKTTTTTTTTATQSSTPTTTKTTTTTTTTAAQSSTPTTIKTTTTTTTQSSSTTKPQTISSQLTTGKPNLQCNFCIGCNSTNIPIKVTCSANDTFCFTQTYNSFTQMGCSSKCTSGFHPTDNSYISCCTTNLCNTYQSVPPSTQTSNRPIQPSSTTYYVSYLECFSCNDCQNTNNIIESCYADQRYCYKEVTNNYVRKGCASSCTNGLTTSNSKVYCCTGNRCNNSIRNYKINFILIFVSAFIGILKYLF